MFALAEFQQRFVAALLHPGDVADSEFGVGLRVYQNTVATGLMDVLRANYSTVEKLVSEAWFADVARLYVRTHLPEQAPLALYGEDFVEFLAGMESARSLPYLPQVAQLDRLWTEAHFAAEAEVLQADAMANFSAEQLIAVRLKLHPAAKLAWVAHSAGTIWMATRFHAAAATLEVSDDEEGLLLVRHNGAVQSLPLDAAEHVFVHRIRCGELLGDAAMAALQKRADVDFTSLLARLIHAGAFQSVLGDQI
jgi:hypothetical protein